MHRFWIGFLILILPGCSEHGFSDLLGGVSSPGPAIEVTPSLLDFGILTQNEESVLSFRVTNVGEDLLDVESIELRGELSFTLLQSDVIIGLAPGEFREFDVAFSPSSTVLNDGDVLVFSNDPERRVEQVALKGLGAFPAPYDEDDCVDSDVVSWSPGEIYVLGSNATTATGVLRASTPGWYAIYDIALAESGGSQTNESAYLQIANSSNPDGRPLYENCEGWWILADSDNDGTAPLDPIYLGTFWLDAGDNEVTLRHYCELYRQGLCTSFHNAAPSNGTCDSSNPNSAHFNGDGVCMTTHADG